MAYSDRNCRYCNLLFTPNNSNQKTCSDDCWHKDKLKYKKSWYMKNAKRLYDRYRPYVKKHAIGRQIALRLIKKLGIKRSCAICSSDYVVDIHHVDGNTSNNGLENLQLLCRYCHTNIHRNK